MPKNAQGTWVGTTQQPTFRTYQTAGMLQPSGSPSTPPPPPVVTPPPPIITPPPVFTPPPVIQPPTDIFHTQPPVSNAPPVSVPVVPQAGDEGRARLAEAIMGVTYGPRVGGTGNGRTNTRLV